MFVGCGLSVEGFLHRVCVWSFIFDFVWRYFGGSLWVEFLVCIFCRNILGIVYVGI